MFFFFHLFLRLVYLNIWNEKLFLYFFLTKITSLKKKMVKNLLNNSAMKEKNQKMFLRTETFKFEKKEKFNK